MAPHSHLCIICMVLLLSCGASAVTISLSPDRIQRGDTVTVAVTDLPDGSVFSILVDGVVVVTPREPFSFELVNFHLPFALNEGSSLRLSGIPSPTS